MAADSLFSPYWYRAAKLHPRLASTVHVTRQVFRGEPWFVLSSQASGRQFRVNKLGFELVGRLDGQRNVQEIWDILLKRLGNDAPSQHEVLGVLSELIAAGMLHSEKTPDLAAIFESSSRHREKSRRARLNPLAFRLPLWNPAPLLDRLLPAGRCLFTRPAFALWLLLVLTAGFLAVLHWPSLQAYANLHLATPRNLLLMWLTYPLIKLLHETGHALAVRTWGGAVHETGITLFLLMPVPYVDASSASAFAEKRRRVLVSAVGVMVELALAGLALLLWLNISDGWLRDTCFAVMIIGTISTLLVNANPLMRFDGYYVLTDALEMPGLGARADNYLRYLGERWLLGNRQLHPPAGIEGRRLLLASYSISALLYRVLLLSGITLWLLGKQFALGAILLIWLLFHFFARPFWKLASLVFNGPRLAAVRTRASLSFATLAAIVLAGFLFYPLPYATRAHGLIWVPDEARVRNDVDGFIEEVLISNGQPVKAGTPLLRLSNPDLLAARQQLQTRLASRQQAYQGTLLMQPASAIALGEEIDTLYKQIAQFDERINALTVHAPLDGRIGLSAAHDLPGQFFQRGSVIAHVINPARMTVRMALAQQDIDLLRSSSTPPRFAVRIAEDRDRTLRATLARQDPGASWQLPSPLLGDRGGGPFVTDPADKDGLRTLEPVFTIDLAIQEQALSRIGSRAWVRIEHAPRPLAMQWGRSLRQLFLRLGGGSEIAASLAGAGK